MTSRIAVGLWAFVCATGYCLGAVSAVEAPDPDAIAERVMEAFDLPGMAVCIVKDDELVAARGYGVREAGKDDPVTPETIFSIGSNGKSFTAAAVSVLVSRGELSWDDVVAEKLPGSGFVEFAVSGGRAMGYTEGDLGIFSRAND